MTEVEDLRINWICLTLADSMLSRVQLMKLLIMFFRREDSAIAFGEGSSSLMSFSFDAVCGVVTKSRMNNWILDFALSPPDLSSARFSAK